MLVFEIKWSRKTVTILFQVQSSVFLLENPVKTEVNPV